MVYQFETIIGSSSRDVKGTVVSTHCMAVPFSFLSRGYRESLHQKNYYSLLLLIGNSDI